MFWIKWVEDSESSVCKIFSPPLGASVTLDSICNSSFSQDNSLLARLSHCKSPAAGSPQIWFPYKGFFEVKIAFPKCQIIRLNDP